jgi:WD40 repeat protein
MTIKLWNVENRVEIATLKGHSKEINSICYSPDGKTIASCSDDNTIKFWDSKNFKETNTIYAHTDFIY